MTEFKVELLFCVVMQAPFRLNEPTMQKLTPNDTKKLSVILDAKLHNRAKRYALINDMTLTELVISLLLERLDQDNTAEEAVRR
jgi:hypothetical protein